MDGVGMRLVCRLIGAPEQDIASGIIPDLKHDGGFQMV